MERRPSTRESAQRLGLVTIGQMTHALVDAIEDPPAQPRLVDVADIRRRQERI